jgi:hypothetical protein
MFPQLASTQSASKHKKNKNNLIEPKSEFSDVKRLQQYIENTEK